MIKSQPTPVPSPDGYDQVEVDGNNGEWLEDGRMKLAELRRRLELEKTEVLSNQKHQKDNSNSSHLPSSLSESSQRTAYNEVYTCTAIQACQSEKLGKSLK